MTDTCCAEGMTHRTQIEYRILNPKPYEAQCLRCPWTAERAVLKAAQTVAEKHERQTGCDREQG